MTRTLLGHRFIFAALITYMATQAHGWAGGLATRPSVTVMTWIGVTLASSVTRNRFALLAIALGTQLGIHFGTAGVHSHCDMQFTMNQMTIGHIVAGTLAWFMLAMSERAFLLAIELLKFIVARLISFPIRVSVSFPAQSRVIESQIYVCRDFILHAIERRGPPLFSM